MNIHHLKNFAIIITLMLISQTSFGNMGCYPTMMGYLPYNVGQSKAPYQRLNDQYSNKKISVLSAKNDEVIEGTIKSIHNSRKLGNLFDVSIAMENGSTQSFDLTKEQLKRFIIE